MSTTTHPTDPLTIEERGSIRGRLHLRATYASSRPGVIPHVVEGKDDGTVSSCTCPGWQTQCHCWHGDNLALDWWRSQWSRFRLTTLQQRDAVLRHYLSLGPDRAEAAAARIELTAIGDLIGARLPLQQEIAS